MRNTRRNRKSNYWENLLKNGGNLNFALAYRPPAEMCWQVYPKILVDMMNDAEKEPKVEAFQKMIKFDIQAFAWCCE